MQRMYIMLITVKKVLKLRPCWSEEQIREYAGDRVAMPLDDVLSDSTIPPAQRLWLAVACLPPRARSLYGVRLLIESRPDDREELHGIVKYMYGQCLLRDVPYSRYSAWETKLLIKSLHSDKHSDQVRAVYTAALAADPTVSITDQLEELRGYLA